MSMHRDDILDWLMDLPEDAEVGVDEGGLTLIVIEHDAHLEIGGIETEDEDLAELTGVAGYNGGEFYK